MTQIPPPIHAPAPDQQRSARHSLSGNPDRRADGAVPQPPCGTAPTLVSTAKATDTARVPIIFASSSMPIADLRAYAAQLEKLGGVIAFRGMPGGMTQIAPMASLTARILRVDTGCEGPACVMRRVQVIVDPLIFRQHGVARVPALTLVPGDPTRPYCERDDDSPRGSQLVYGDAALTGLLEEYARLGGKEEVRDVEARFGQLGRQ